MLLFYAGGIFVGKGATNERNGEGTSAFRQRDIGKRKTDNERRYYRTESES